MNNPKVLWIAEMSFSEQVRSQGTRSEIPVQREEIQRILRKCGISSVKLTQGSEPIPALIGMRMKVISITEGEDGIRVRWQLSFLHFELGPIFQKVLQSLTELLEPRYPGGIVDVFYHLPPDRIPISWEIAKELEGQRLLWQRALTHNALVHSKWYCFFVPEQWISGYLGLFRKVYSTIPNLSEIPDLPEIDHWEQPELRQQIDHKIVRGLLMFPLDSLWRAVYSQPFPAAQLKKMGYHFGPQDGTIFNADDRLAKVLAEHQQNLRNLQNYTISN